jgi:hypothetical protein
MDELHQFYFWVLFASQLAFNDTMQPNIELILTARDANRRRNRGTALISCQRNIDNCSRIHRNSIVMKNNCGTYTSIFGTLFRLEVDNRDFSKFKYLLELFSIELF